MQNHRLWFAASFAVLPAIVFACGGGRSDIDLLLDSTAGSAGISGKGGAGGVAGKGGASGGIAGVGGQINAGSGGAIAAVCKPGEQIECACPATTLKGVQVCNPQGTGFHPCMGCPENQGGSSQGGEGGSSNGGDAGNSTAGKGGEPADGGSDFFDALPFPLPDSGPVGECVGCLQENCNDAINKCYNNKKCVDGIQCAVTSCFAGGALDGGGSGGNGMNFQCLLGCFGGDPMAVLSAMQAFQCITQTCGDSCGGGILGDGGFPFGGLGGGQTPGNPPNPGGMYMQGVRVPLPAEVPGYPQLQEALTPRH